MDIENAKKSIFRIICGNFQGTCFHYKNGIIVSAFHNVAKIINNKIELLGETIKLINEFHTVSFSSMTIDIEHKDTQFIKHDIIIFTNEDVKTFILQNNIPENNIGEESTVDEDVKILGYPLYNNTNNPTLARGYINRQDEKHMYISFSNVGGFSGSPIFNNEGFVLGIVNAKSLVPCPYIRSYLETEKPSNILHNGEDTGIKLKNVILELYKNIVCSTNLMDAHCFKLKWIL